jgi:hypothetical protein
MTTIPVRIPYDLNDTQQGTRNGQDLRCVLLIALRCPSLGSILNLHIAEVVYNISNLPKTIILIQKPIIDQYLAESSPVHRGESSISGWYPYPLLMGVLIG